MHQEKDTFTNDVARGHISDPDSNLLRYYIVPYGTRSTWYISHLLSRYC